MYMRTYNYALQHIENFIMHYAYLEHWVVQVVAVQACMTVVSYVVVGVVLVAAFAVGVGIDAGTHHLDIVHNSQVGLTSNVDMH